MTNLLISPFKTGLDIDFETWLAPIDSFSILDNIHIKHGYLQKREGFRPFGHLIPIGATVNINNVSQADPGEVTTAVAHGYSTGDKVFIASVGGMTEINNKIFTITVTAATRFTIGLDTTSLTAYTAGGTVAVTDSSTDRVMGITRYIDAIGTKTSICFNARRAYRFNKVTNSFVQLDVANILSSGEYDYIWSSNWQSSGGTNRLYFTNGIAGTPAAAPTSDGIRYFDGTTDPNNTVSFYPTIRTATTLVGGKLIFTLGQRLVVLNTYEYDTVATTNYPQRARWCAKQNPANWNDVTAGGGGYTDAATGEQIISARALQNQIIVFFTNSVWSLVSTSDPNRAFKWQKINSFRACDGKMATIGYDRYVVALGLRGITATDGVETRRVDDRISDFSINDINPQEFQKVFCERSYSNKRWWTLYNDTETSDNENNSALIYDDDSSAYSTYTINMNCLGYGAKTLDASLDDFTEENELDLALDDFGDEDLFSYFLQENEEELLGGDIYGSIYVMETDGDDNGHSIVSNFVTAAWNPFKEEGFESKMLYIDIYADSDLNTRATIGFLKDTDTDAYTFKTIDFLPNLNYVAKINNATTTNPVSINSPNNGLVTGDIIYIYGVEGMTEINSGETAENYTVTVVDENNFTLDGINGTTFNAFTSGGSIYLRKYYKTKVWKRVYAGGTGFQHKIKFTSTGIDKPFRIHAFKPVFKKIGKRQIN